MGNFRYTVTDEEIRSYYGELLHEFKTNDISDTQYHEDIALLMAHINKLLSYDPNDVNPINIERWKIALETIKLKAGLIKEQRMERERQERSEERRMKLNAIPVDDFRNAIASVISIVIKYVETDKVTSVISDLNEVIAACKPVSS